MLRHSIEVAFLSQMIAEQLGLNGAIARRCGFLHDIGKAMDHEMEGGHPKIGMDFAKQYGEKDPRVLTLRSIISSCEIAEAVMQLVISSVA